MRPKLVCFSLVLVVVAMVWSGLVWFDLVWFFLCTVSRELPKLPRGKEGGDGEIIEEAEVSQSPLSRWKERNCSTIAARLLLHSASGTPLPSNLFAWQPRVPCVLRAGEACSHGSPWGLFVLWTSLAPVPHM